jgi:hypothetical protein
VAKLFHSRGPALVALLAALVVMAVAAPSQAALLPTAPTAVCPSVRQVFLPWNDSAYYGLVPGASFEGSLGGWALYGGATVVAGNEPSHVTAPTDARSLYLPAGSTVTTPPACFQFADWQLRFFARSVGSSGGQLHVRVIARGLLGGVLSVLDEGTVSTAPDGSWQLSDPVDISLLTQLSISIQFTAVGGGFQIDDVYLDPSMMN